MRLGHVVCYRFAAGHDASGGAVLGLVGREGVVRGVLNVLWSGEIRLPDLHVDNMMPFPLQLAGASEYLKGRFRAEVGHAGSQSHRSCYHHQALLLLGCPAILFGRPLDRRGAGGGGR